jgi:hypothetical protein
VANDGSLYALLQRDHTYEQEGKPGPVRRVNGIVRRLYPTVKLVIRAYGGGVPWSYSRWVMNSTAASHQLPKRWAVLYPGVYFFIFAHLAF